MLLLYSFHLPCTVPLPFGINVILTALASFVFTGVPIHQMVSEVIQIDRREPAAYTGATKCDFVSDKYMSHQINYLHEQNIYWWTLINANKFLASGGSWIPGTDECQWTVQY